MTEKKPDLGWVHRALAIASAVGAANDTILEALERHDHSAGSGGLWYTVGLEQDGELDLGRDPIKGNYSPAIKCSDDRIDDLDVRHMPLVELEASDYGFTLEVSVALSTILREVGRLSDYTRMLAEGVLDDLEPEWRGRKS